MLRTLIAVLLAMSQATVVHAASEKVQALMKKLDCATYHLTERGQRIRLSSSNAILGATSAWAVLNERPTPATIYASNGEKIPLGVFDGKLEIFVGDER